MKSTSAFFTHLAIISTLALSCTLLVSARAYAGNPVIDCYKTALQDSDVLVYSKRAGNYPASVQYAVNIESLALKLCHGTGNATAPIDCFKLAMKDPEVLAASKRAYGFPISEQYAPSLEETVVNLCSTVASTAATTN